MHAHTHLRVFSFEIGLLVDAEFSALQIAKISDLLVIRQQQIL